MSGKVAVQLGIDICRGLQDVHAAGIVMGNLTQVCTPISYISNLSATTQAILSQRIDALLTAYVVSFGPSSLSFKQNALHSSQRCPTCSRHTVCLLQTNILICNSGSAVLADFGLAQAADDGQEDSAYSSAYK